MTTDTLPRLLAALRVGLHVMFAILLAFGMAQAYERPFVLALSALLGAVYLVGTVLERRRSLRGETTSKVASTVWLAVITALWTCLVILSPDFVWLEFPLVFLHYYLLPRPWALLNPVILWALAAFIPSWTEGVQVSAMVGPAIGTLFAVGIAVAYSMLHGEARRYQGIAKRLQATQEQLVAAEHQAGRLEERERLAREIHDTLAQGFSSLVLVSRAAKNSVDRRDRHMLMQQLDTIHDVAQDNLTEARRFVHQLNDATATLEEELHRVVRQIRRRGQALGEETSFELRVPESVPQVPDAVREAIVRLVQEGLNNVVKHAHARRAVVTLGVFAEELTVDVVDDGQGMRGTSETGESTGVSGPDTGYGLPGLRRRIATLGGTLDISPGPGPAARPGIALSARIPRQPGKEA